MFEYIPSPFFAFLYTLLSPICKGIRESAESEESGAGFRLQSAAMRWVQRATLLLAVVLLARPAWTHPVPFSYLDVRLSPSSLDVSLTVHIFDLAHDLMITPM